MLSWAAIKLLPWRLIAAIALCAAIIVGVMYWHTQGLERATAAGYASAKAECVEAARVEQEKADARVADQRFNADAATKRAAVETLDFNKKMQRYRDAISKSDQALNSCRLDANTARVLNDARTAAVGDDRPATASSAD